MAATEKQHAHLEKARMAKMLKNTEQNNENSSDNIKYPAYTEYTPSDSNYNDKIVWINALVVAMRNLEVKHQGVVASCVPIADAALAAYKAKFK